MCYHLLKYCVIQVETISHKMVWFELITILPKLYDKQIEIIETF